MKHNYEQSDVTHYQRYQKLVKYIKCYWHHVLIRLRLLFSQGGHRCRSWYSWSGFGWTDLIKFITDVFKNWVCTYYNRTTSKVLPMWKLL